MNELLQWLPVLNLLVIPVFVAYVKNEVRLAKLEKFQERAEKHPCFSDQCHKPTH